LSEGARDCNLPYGGSTTLRWTGAQRSKRICTRISFIGPRSRAARRCDPICCGIVSRDHLTTAGIRKNAFGPTARGTRRGSGYTSPSTVFFWPRKRPLFATAGRRFSKYLKVGPARGRWFFFFLAPGLRMASRCRCPARSDIGKGHSPCPRCFSQREGALELGAWGNLPPGRNNCLAGLWMFNLYCARNPCGLR